MRTIYGQVIASTAEDAHGSAIPVDKLRVLFDQIPDPWIMCDNHDPAKPPTCRTYNKQFVKLESNNWAICADVEIYDEAACKDYGGFSIAFTTSRFSVNPNREAEIVVTLNPRLLPLEEFHELARQSTDDCQLDVSDLFQKSLDVPAIIFLTLAGGGIATGFFRAAGADLYGLVKKKIQNSGERVRREHGVELQCNITFEIQHRSNLVSVLVTVRSADLDVLANRGVTAETIIDRIGKIAGNPDLQKVVIRATASDPVIFVEYYTDRNGVVHKPTVSAN